MDPVVHFELPCKNRERLARFFETVFGWKCQMLGPEMGDYTVVTTAEQDVNPKGMRGAIGGGFFLQRPGMPAQFPGIVVAVENLRASMKKVTDAGGQVLGDEPWDIPGVGLYIAFLDTEGNRSSMLQPHPAM